MGKSRRTTQVEPGQLHQHSKAPTYGTCADCWASGPSYQPCQECGKDLYMPLDLRGYVIDSQTFGEKMKKPHHIVRAGLTQNKATTDTMKFDCEAITLQITQDFEKEHPYFKDEDEEHPLGPHQKTQSVTSYKISFKNMMNC
jgi:hypothetical protein